jgi:hypothetical protein
MPMGAHFEFRLSSGVRKGIALEQSLLPRIVETFDLSLFSRRMLVNRSGLSGGSIP